MRPKIERRLCSGGYQWLVFVPWYVGCWGPNTTGYALFGGWMQFADAVDDVRKYYAKRAAGTLGQRS